MASYTGSEGPKKPSSKPSDGVAEAVAVPIKKIGKYEIQKKIGAGGMGAVYLALDPSLKRLCALKVLPVEKAQNPILVRRFKSEAQVAANLRHENIVTVFEAGEADGLSYIALEYVEGIDVAKLVSQRGNVPLKRSIEIIRQVAKALEHAHEKGMVHRDIKPGNLLLRRDGVVKLADLGLARMLDDNTDTSITRAGTTVGTVDYMAPEQARDSKAADVRSDIYSLGCTWYFMLTGHPPFPEGSLTNKLRAHAETLIPDPRQDNPKVSEAVFGVIRRMTEKKPGKRYQTPTELLADLDVTSLTSDIVSDTIFSDMPAGPPTTSGRRSKESKPPAVISFDDEDGWDDEFSDGPAAPSRRTSDGNDSNDDSSTFARRSSPANRSSHGSQSSDDTAPAHNRPRSRTRSSPENNSQSDDDLAATGSPRKQAGNLAVDDPASPVSPASGARSKADNGATASGDSPAFKPPPGRDVVKPDAKEARKNTAIFYAGVGLLVVGSVFAVIYLVKEYGTAVDSTGGQLTNTFGQPGAGENASRTGQDAPQVVSGNAQQTVEGNAPGQPLSRTTIVSSDNPGATGPGGEPIPGANVGPNVTRVTSDGDSAKTETTGAGTGATSVAGTGNNSADPTATPNGTATPGGSESSSDSRSNDSTGTAVASRGSGGSGYNSGTSGTSGSGSTGGSGATSGSTSAASLPTAFPSARRTSSEASFVPAWVKAPRPVDGIPRFVVKPGGSGKGQYSTLNQAFAQIPAGGAIIQLVGNGPFPLNPVKIADKVRVVIEPRDAAGTSSVPLIVLLPSEKGPATAFIETSNTALDLRNVHLALDASRAPANADNTLISANASDVSLVNCSLSVKGMQDAPVTALKVSGRVAREGDKSSSRTHVLVENTLIRGNHLTGLAVDTDHVDVTYRNSLVWSGAAPVVRFGATGKAEKGASRNLVLISTTLCSQKSAIEMAGDANDPVPCSLSFVNSLVAASGGTAPALFDMRDWSQNQQKAALGKSITWNTVDTLYTGWKTLIQLNPGAIASATTQAQWILAWKDNKAAPSKEQFQPAVWPAQPVKDIGTVNVAAILAAQSVGKQLIKTGDGGWPGCLTASLYVLKLDSVGSQPMASRLEIPQGMFGFVARNTLRVDASKEDLGKFIDRQTLVNGTQIVVTGSGNPSTSPIVIEGAWVRLTFEPPAGTSLVLSPRSSADSKQEGLINVTNGGLEIVGGAFTIPTSDRQVLPKWFIKVVDGDLAMSRCRVHGPMVGPTRNKGLINLQRSSGKAPPRMFDGGFDGYAAFSDCYLIGSGTLLEADMHRRAVFFRNSIAVSRDDLLSLSIRGKESQIGGVVDLAYSTLSAVDRVIHVDGAELGSPTDAPLVIVADRCVFAPPLRSVQQKASPKYFSYSGPVLEEKQVSWWENRCGYSADITQFLRADSDPATTTAQDFEQVWVAQWGRSQVVEPLLGIKGVVLKGDLPTKLEDRLKLEPADFELHKAAKAGAWDGSDRAIGASVAKMNPPLIRTAGASPSTKPKTPKKNDPTTPPVSF